MLFGSVMTFYVTINVLCSIIIVIMLVMMKFGVMHETEQKIFFNLCVQCLLFFFLDVFWVLLDGAGFAGARTLNLCVNAAYFSQLGILCFFWSRYSFFLAEYRIRLTDLRILYCSPLFINVAMSVASIWTGWFFNVDAEGRYQAEAELKYIHEETEGTAQRPSIGAMASYGKKYGFPIGPDAGIIETAMQYGKTMLANKKYEHSVYFLDIAYKLTENKELKDLLDKINAQITALHKA